MVRFFIVFKGLWGPSWRIWGQLGVTLGPSGGGSLEGCWAHLGQVGPFFWGGQLGCFRAFVDHGDDDDADDDGDDVHDSDDGDEDDDDDDGDADEDADDDDGYDYDYECDDGGDDDGCGDDADAAVDAVDDDDDDGDDVDDDDDDGDGDDDGEDRCFALSSASLGLDIVVRWRDGLRKL